MTEDRKNRIHELLCGDGINQIAALAKNEWAYIKRLHKSGKVITTLDYGFPRVTKRYAWA